MNVDVVEQGAGDLRHIFLDLQRRAMALFFRIGIPAAGASLRCLFAISGVPPQDRLIRLIQRLLTTIGDHIKKRRLDLGLFQKQVAAQIGADEMTICNWELKLTEPEVCFIPKIIEFLDYNPLPEARTLAEQIIRGR